MRSFPFYLIITTVLDKILTLFLTIVQLLHNLLLKGIERVENAENVEVLVGLAILVIFLSVILWGLNLLKSILGASVNVLEHTVNMLKRIAKFSGYILILLLLAYYIFAIERQCFHEIEQGFTNCLNQTEWKERKAKKAVKNTPSTHDKGK